MLCVVNTRKGDGVNVSYRRVFQDVKNHTIKTLRYYDEYFQLIPSIGERVASKYPDLKCTTPEYCFVKYLDGEYKEKNISIEYCEAIDKLEDNFEDIVFKKIPAVTAVSVLHKGPYRTLSKAYSYIMKWIEDDGYSITECPRESYIDGIWNKETNEEWLTEIQIPILNKKLDDAQ